MSAEFKNFARNFWSDVTQRFITIPIGIKRISAPCSKYLYHRKVIWIYMYEGCSRYTGTFEILRKLQKASFIIFLHLSVNNIIFNLTKTYCFLSNNNPKKTFEMCQNSLTGAYIFFHFKRGTVGEVFPDIVLYHYCII